MENTPGLCPRCAWQRALEPEEASPEPIESDVDPAWLAEHGFGETNGGEPGRRTFAGYELGAELGRGGMGVVYAALQPGLNRRVALKILSPTISGAGTDAQRFQNEVEAASRLDHPNILPVYEFGEHEGQWFYTMRLAEGGNLAEHISDFGFRVSDLSPTPGEIKERQRRIAELILQLSRAVAYAHQRGILHRDLKPANILLDGAGTACVSDFGLAKFLEEDRGLTLTQGIVGTPGYMAPEQASGRKGEVTTATDVYGLGTILYELLTRRAPFAGDSTVELLRQVAEQDVEAPRHLCPQVDRDLETICLKCLAKQPARRYPTADALAEDLERWLNGEIITARRAGAPERLWRWCRRRPALATLSVAVAALALFASISAVRLGLAVRAEQQESYYADISLAYHHIAEGNIDHALEILLACPEDMRHWEWGHLMYLCHQQVASIRFDADSLAQGAALYAFPEPLLRELSFSPDGQYFATLRRDGLFKIWDVQSNQEVFTMGDSSNRVDSFAFSRDSRRLAIGGAGGVRILETEDWRPAQTLLTGDAAALSLSWGRLEEQDLLAAAFPGGTIQAWSVEAQDSRERFQIKLPGAKSVSFTEDSMRLAVSMGPEVAVIDARSGDTLARMTSPSRYFTLTKPDPQGWRWVTIDADLRVQLWESAERVRELGVLRGAIPQFITQIFFSPDGTRFCTGGEDGTARVWDAATGAELFSIPVRVCHAAFSPDGGRLVTAGHDMQAYVWDVESKRQIRALSGHREVVERVAFSPNGWHVLTASRDGTVGVWSGHAGREILEGGALMWGAAYSPDGKLCSMTPCGRGLWVWDAEGGTILHQFNAERDFFGIAAFSPDGTSVATDSIMLREPRVWDLRTGKVLHSLRGHQLAVVAITYSPYEPKLVTADYGGIVRTWDADTGEALFTIKAQSIGFPSIAISPCGKFLATGSLGEETVRVWSMSSGECLQELPGHTEGCVGLRFLPGDGRLAAQLAGSSMYLWNVENGELTQQIRLRGLSYYFDFTPDGKRLAIWPTKVGWMGFDVPSLEIWDVAAGRLILSLRGHEDRGTMAVFSGDGRRLLTTAGDFTARQWESFPWLEAEYPVSPGTPFPERIRAYAAQYWQQRRQAELTARQRPMQPKVNRVPFDRAKIPARSLEATPAQLDLTSHYTSPLELPFFPSFFDDFDKDLSEFAPGLAEFDGVCFDVRGVVQFRRYLPDYLPINYSWHQLPLKAEPIPVQSMVRRLHLLHGTAYSVKDGTAIATLRWHYADGTQRETEIRYGEHVRDWWVKNDSLPATQAQVAWHGSNPTAQEAGTEVRIYQAQLDNPRPDLIVESLDIVAERTPCAYFVLAITAE